MSDTVIKDADMEIIMSIIVDAGNARSCSMEAIRQAKEGVFEEAQESLKIANESLASAHRVQTDLIQQAAKGQQIDINLFMVHAQDHIMTAMLAKDLAAEIVELYVKIG
jgi:PTS system cellobiose-specific IIA component